MPEWIPTRGSAKGRLVLAALAAFGADGYAAVSVADLAKAAETTTGPLYHHFESKLGLYAFVREDVERRVLDRLEGALAVGAEPADALAVAYDYVRRAGFLRMLAEAHPDGRADPIAELLSTHLRPPLGAMLAAAWRAALDAAATGAPDADVRAAILALRPAGAEPRA